MKNEKHYPMQSKLIKTSIKTVFSNKSFLQYKTSIVFLVSIPITCKVNPKFSFYVILLCDQHGKEDQFIWTAQYIIHSLEDYILTKHF
jgi:hypothetical protein